MKNKLLFVESNTTGTGMLALRQAQSWGLSPVFVTNKPERYLGLEETGCPVFVCDTNSLDEVKRVIEDNLSIDELCGVTTTSEYYLETVAALADSYGLLGNPLDAMRTCRNKSLTRLRLAEANVRQPRFAIVRTSADIEQAVASVGLPCVVKPADDSGSNDVVLCRTAEQVEQQTVKILAKPINVRGQQTAMTVLVEQYLDAPEYSVEMFAWEGELTCIGITEKSLTGFPYFVESRHLFPAALSPEVEADIRTTVQQALQAAGIRNGATHTEVKLTAEGCAIIEINARLAGGMIPELVRLAKGIDLLEQQIRCAFTAPTQLEAGRSLCAGIQFIMADQEGTLAEVQGVEAALLMPGVQQVTVTAKPGTAVRPPENFSHRLGYVIVQGDSYEEAKARLQAATAVITVVLEHQLVKE